MSSSREIDAALNSDYFTTISNGEQILEDMDKEDMAIFHCMVVPCNSHEFFTSHEIEEGVGQSVDPMVDVQDVLTTM
jgi:hypothetical protein